MEAAAFLGLALLLGVKHAYDPDHLAVVGLFVGRAASPRRAVGLGLRWALGHALTAGTLTAALFLAKDQLPTGWLGNLELVAAASLVLIGGLALVWELKRIHTHPHAHGGLEHAHPHLHLFGRDAHHAMLGLGLLHGLASNDEVLLLLTASLGVVSLAGLLAGVGLFSLGVVAGMALFAALLALPLARARSRQVHRAVNLLTGTASIMVGAAMLLGPRL